MKQVQYRLFVGIENPIYSYNLDELIILAKEATAAKKCVELQVETYKRDMFTGNTYWGWAGVRPYTNFR